MNIIFKPRIKALPFFGYQRFSNKLACFYSTKESLHSEEIISRGRNTKDIAKEIQDWLLISQPALEILEGRVSNQDYDRDKIKEINAVRFSITKELRNEIKDQTNYIPRKETLDYLKANEFLMNYAKLSNILSLSKIIENTSTEVEILFKARQRSLTEIDKTQQEGVFGIKQLKELDDRFFVKEMGGVVLPWEQEKRKYEMKMKYLDPLDPLQLIPNDTFLRAQICVRDLNIKNCLVFTCNHLNHEIDISGVYDIENAKEFDHSREFDKIEKENKFYSPCFINLSEILQKRLIDYLQSLGITGELFQHMNYLSYLREEVLYMQWLQEVHKFVVDL